MADMESEVVRHEEEEQQIHHTEEDGNDEVRAPLNFSLIIQRVLGYDMC
jgi:hypothetical protein